MRTLILFILLNVCLSVCMKAQTVCLMSSVEQRTGCEYFNQDYCPELDNVRISCAFHCIGSDAGNFTPLSGPMNGPDNISQVLTESNSLFSNPLDHPIYDNPGDLSIQLVPHNGTLTNSIFYWESMDDYNNNYTKIPGALDVKFVNQAIGNDDYVSGAAEGTGTGDYVELYDFQKSIGGGLWFPWDYGRVLNHEVGHILGLGHSNQAIVSECNTVDIDVAYEAGACWDCSPANCNCSNNTMTQGTQCQCSWTLCQKKTMHGNIVFQKYSFASYDMYGEDYVINDKVIFDNSVIVPKNLIIEAGGELTISCTVKFNTNSHLIVKRGGKLIVDGGNLTSILDYGEWQGIKLEGNGTDQPDPFLALNADDAGVVIMKNIARIANAKTGILCEKFGEEWDSNYYGGLVVADNAFFTNNIRGVGFMPFNNDASRFRDVRFDNKRFGVTMWKNSGVTFNACKFLNQVNVGIYGIDSHLNIVGGEELELNNVFENNTFGVFIKYTSEPIGNSNTISNNRFLDNFKDIKIQGASNGNDISNNSFEDSDFGIDIDGKNSFIINNNEFNSINEHAIISKSSGNQKSEISQNNFAFNNSSIELAYDNSGKTFFENCFENSTEIDVFLNTGQIALTHGSPLKAAANCFTQSNTALDVIAQDMLSFFYYYYDPVFASEDFCDNPTDLDIIYKRKGEKNEWECSSEISGFQEDECDFVLKSIDVDSLIGELETSITILELDTLNQDSTQYLQDSIEISKLKNCLNKVLTQYADSLITEGNCNKAFHLFNRQSDEYLQVKAFSVLLDCDDCQKAAMWLDDFHTTNQELAEYLYVQSINLKRLCTNGKPEYTRDELDNLYNLTDSRYPFGAYARALWHEITGEHISLETPHLRKDIVDPRSTINITQRVFSVYPNPTTSELHYVCDKEYNTGEVIIQSITGEILMNSQIASLGKRSIDISNFKNGLYLISLVTEETTEVIKFMKN